jgi:hypothetical protein
MVKNVKNMQNKYLQINDVSASWRVPKTAKRN